MRAKGYNRPLSIFHIRAAARRKFSTIGKKSMLAMLTPTSKSESINFLYNYIDYCVSNYRRPSSG